MNEENTFDTTGAVPMVSAEDVISSLMKRRKDIINITVCFETDNGDVSFSCSHMDNKTLCMLDKIHTTQVSFGLLGNV